MTSSKNLRKAQRRVGGASDRRLHVCDWSLTYCGSVRFANAVCCILLFGDCCERRRATSGEQQRQGLDRGGWLSGNRPPPF